MASQFNLKLQMVVEELNTNLARFGFLFFDVYRTTMEIINNPSTYGTFLSFYLHFFLQMNFGCLFIIIIIFILVLFHQYGVDVICLTFLHGSKCM